MKLYRIRLTRVLYVLAEEAGQAERWAEEAPHNSSEVEETEISVATREEMVDDGWENSEPWGIRMDKTCGELMREWEELDSSPPSD